MFTASVNAFEMKVQAALDGGRNAIAARNAGSNPPRCPASRG
jgi:hypothetical protein